MEANLKAEMHKALDELINELERSKKPEVIGEYHLAVTQYEGGDSAVQQVDHVSIRWYPYGENRGWLSEGNGIHDCEKTNYEEDVQAQRETWFFETAVI